jgi:hypothetical protein
MDQAGAIRGILQELETFTTESLDQEPGT